MCNWSHRRKRMWQNKYLKIEQLKFFQIGGETDLQIEKFNKSQSGKVKGNYAPA